MSSVPGLDQGSAESHFHAIERSFEETLHGQEDVWWVMRFLDGPIGGALVPIWLFIVPWYLSIPCSRLLTKWFGHRFLPVFWVRLEITSQAVVGVVLVAVWFAVTVWAFVHDAKSTKRKAANYLNPAQMRFACCFAIIRDLKSFQDDGLPKHLEQATYLWRMLLRSLNSLFAGEVYKQVSRKQLLSNEKLVPKKILPSSTERLRQLFSWFCVEADTSSILGGLDAFPAKLSARLQEAKDIPACVESLRLLGDYLYSLLPEVSRKTEIQARELSDWGNKKLLDFGQKVMGLPDFNVTPDSVSDQESLSKRLLRSLGEITNLFSHESILICFSAWVILCALVVVLALRLCTRWFGVHMDSTLLATAIGTPLIVAASLVALSRRRGGTKQSP